jgi:tRNA pseudouridine(55) synthase
MTQTRMPRYITIEKRLGETPLEALERARIDAHISKGTPLAYAGRLDPMATGKLLILVGDECKVQETYHCLDKEYMFEIMFGFGSDTGDVLGLIEETGDTMVSEQKLKALLGTLRGTLSLPFPHFSSRTVHGKPLHVWTLEKRLHEIEIPVQTSKIHSLTLMNTRTIPLKDAVAQIRSNIKTITPVTDPKKALGKDFRRGEIETCWERVLHENPDAKVMIATCKAVVSSGTYIRSLAPRIANLLGTKGLAYSIHRTKIGKYVSMGNFGVWTKRF